MHDGNHDILKTDRQTDPEKAGHAHPHDHQHPEDHKLDAGAFRRVVAMATVALLVVVFLVWRFA